MANALDPRPADRDWDGELAAIGGHFLQSSAWQRALEAMGARTVRAAGDGWRWAGTVRSVWGARYLYLPYGPAAVGDALPAALASVTDEARRGRLDFARVEPLTAPGPVLAAARARPSRSVQPRHTWVLDLGADEAALRSGLSEGHRGSVNAAARRGLRLRRAEDPAEVALFLRLLRATAADRRFHAHPDGYYRTLLDVLMPLGAASLYVAEAGGAAVAAAIAFDFAGTRYYAHAAADPGSRRLQAAAPLVWRMILDARAAGARQFDFWGVAPGADPAHPWHGLSRFKRAFGGRLVERAGTWDIPVRPLRHRLYSAGRRLAAMARRS